MVGLLSTDHRRIGGQHEVDPGPKMQANGVVVKDDSYYNPEFLL